MVKPLFSFFLNFFLPEVLQMRTNKSVMINEQDRESAYVRVCACVFTVSTLPRLKSSIVQAAAACYALFSVKPEPPASLA